MMATQNKITNRRQAIEESFPLVEINGLAERERNTFKPIYQMHKWFARRASCVFRAILLGAMKPIGSNIMEEFYKDHTDDPNTKGKVVLDPFMGGGTTIVEALRLGCKVIGIDLNPVAWFIVKTEVEPVDVNALWNAFERLANRKTASGKSVREELLSHYKTECPCCGTGREEADIIYTFWVKSAICTNPLCKKEVPLFSDYIIAKKNPSIRYYRDTTCPQCGRSFDWEIEPAALIAERSLMVNSTTDSAGPGRGNKRWIYSAESPVDCPWCTEKINPTLSKAKPEHKKVPLSVLLCPHCQTVWQFRGTVPNEVTCLVCENSYSPHEGNVPQKGKFVCPHCGSLDRIINSVRQLPEDELLPIRAYAVEGYCKDCAGEREEETQNENLFGEKTKKKRKKVIDHPCFLTKNRGKFFKRFAPADMARFKAVCERWKREKDNLPYPETRIPDGQETHRLLEHHFRYWHQMFNIRQLFCLSTLLDAIIEEKNFGIRMGLLSAFQNLLDCHCMFAYRPLSRQSLARMFTYHAFQHRNQPTEISLWGVQDVGYSFPTFYKSVIKGKKFGFQPYDFEITKSETAKIYYKEQCYPSRKRQVIVRAADSKDLSFLDSRADLIITDPPYGGNVNYAELSDFSYVWLRLGLRDDFQEFSPEYVPKQGEIVENRSRNKDEGDFREGLTKVFAECNRLLKNEGILAFTFHHSESRMWQVLLKAVLDAEFQVEAVYPIHAEAENSPHLASPEAISYDLIHVCRKRYPRDVTSSRSWAGIRQEIRRRAREEIKAIEAGRYGNEPLSPADVNIILIGKCLELYSRHYGAVVDHEGEEVSLKQALEEIKMMVDQLITTEEPLPAELSDIDPESYVYFTCLCDRKEIKSDEVHKATRGILEVDALLKSGLIIRGRGKRGRTYEVKQPSERVSELLEKFQDLRPEVQPNLFGEIPPESKKRKTYFVDKIHLLMALIEAKENVVPWLERWRGDAPQIRASCEYIERKRKDFAPLLQKILDLMDVGPLFR